MHTQFMREMTHVKDQERTVQEAAARLYDIMHDDERLALLQGNWSLSQYFSQRQVTKDNATPYPASAAARLGIPGFHVVDGARGSEIGCSTEFPSPSARAASFDCLQEERIGDAIGAEVRANGGNLYSGVCLNIARHPAWGRSHESYGEDSLLVGAMGTSVSKGVRKHVMVAVRHFALNSIGNLREDGDIHCDEETMNECYLQHFKNVLLDSSADMVLCASNTVNGVPCAENALLLNGIIRERWNLKNVILASDFTSRLKHGAASVRAGLDLEMPSGTGRMTSIQQALDHGGMKWEVVQVMVERVLAAQLQYYARSANLPVPTKNAVRNKAHIDLARQAVASSMVVLKNDGKLVPLSKTKHKNIAVLGVMANRTQDHTEELSYVHTPHGITPLESIRSQNGITVNYEDGLKINQAVKAAKAADAVILFMGRSRPANDSHSKMRKLRRSVDLSSWSFKPESMRSRHNSLEPTNTVHSHAQRTRRSSDHSAWSFKTNIWRRNSSIDANNAPSVRDRGSIALDDDDVELAKAVAEVAGPKMIIVIEASSSVVIPKFLRQKCAAILFSSYGGRQFPYGLKDVLFGVREASGRLPFIMPESEQQLPEWRPDAIHVTYDKFWGYRLLQARNEKAAYPFGYGLGYSEFALSNLWSASHLTSGIFDITVRATNVGARPSAVVVQIYGRHRDRRRDSARGSMANGSVSPPRLTRRLLGFAKEVVMPGESTEIPISCRLSPLAYYDTETSKLKVMSGEYEIGACRFEGDEKGVFSTVKISQDIVC